MANLVTAMLAFLLPSHAFAHKRNFVWQYGAATAFRGEREYELWLTWNAKTDEGEHLTEFEFGITEPSFWTPTIAPVCFWVSPSGSIVALTLNCASSAVLNF